MAEERTRAGWMGQQGQQVGGAGTVPGSVQMARLRGRGGNGSGRRQGAGGGALHREWGPNRLA